MYKENESMNFGQWLTVLVAIPGIVISLLKIYDWIEHRRKKANNTRGA
jgi:hypothetical protein